MITQMGFSDLLGDVDLDSRYARLSSETKQQIETEVRRIMDEARQRARRILTARRRELDILARALVEYEVLNLDEMQRVLKGEKLLKLGQSGASGGGSGGVAGGAAAGGSDGKGSDGKEEGLSGLPELAGSEGSAEEVQGTAGQGAA